MVEIITALISGLTSIIVACVGISIKKQNERHQEDAQEAAAHAKRRAEEGKLQLQMINANTQLTIGVAMALKHGHCNGEVEEGLRAVKQAQTDYNNFLKGIAIENLK